MGHALVVYESMYGNTEVIARAVGSGLTGCGGVDLLEVATAPPALAADVALVGGPTHAFGSISGTTSSRVRLEEIGTGGDHWRDERPPNRHAR